MKSVDEAVTTSEEEKTMRSPTIPKLKAMIRTQYSLPFLNF